MALIRDGYKQYQELKAELIAEFKKRANAFRGGFPGAKYGYTHIDWAEGEAQYAGHFRYEIEFRVPEVILRRYQFGGDVPVFTWKMDWEVYHRDYDNCMELIAASAWRMHDAWMGAQYKERELELNTVNGILGGKNGAFIRKVLCMRAPDPCVETVSKIKDGFDVVAYRYTTSKTAYMVTRWRRFGALKEAEKYFEMIENEEERVEIWQLVHGTRQIRLK